MWVGVSRSIMMNTGTAQLQSGLEAPTLHLFSSYILLIDHMAGGRPHGGVQTLKYK